MSTLKELKLENLSKSNADNFQLDCKIIEYRKKFGILRDNKAFLKEVGINSAKYGGRLVSLINRGHIEPYSTTSSVDKTSKNLYTLKGSVKVNAIKALKSGMKNKDVSTTFNISLATVTRLKKRIVDGNIPTKLKEVKVNLKEVDKPKVGDFTNNKGVNKEIARNKMAKYIIDSNVEGLIPTLPYIHANIEKKILAQNENYEFIGVEKLPIVYDAMVQTIKNENLPIKPYLGEFCDKIYGAKENQYAHIIGDYCGELPTFASEVEYAVSNKIVKVGGIMALTFGKPIRSKCLKSDSIFKLGSFITNHDTDVRSQSDKAIEGYFQRLIGFDFELTEIFNYHDDKGKGKGYPMVLVILKRLR